MSSIIYGVVEFLKLFFGTKYILNKEINVKKIHILFYIIAAVAIWMYLKEDYKIHSMLFVLNVLCVILLTHARWNRGLGDIIFLQLTISAVDEVIEVAVIQIIGQAYAVVGNLQFYVGSFITLILELLVIRCYMQHRKWIDEAIVRWANQIIRIAAVIVIISMFMTVAGLNYAKNYIDDVDVVQTMRGTAQWAYAAVGILCVVIFALSNAYRTNKGLLKKSEYYNQLQKEYYLQLLQKEADTRKFRHDLSNHLLSIRGLLVQEKYTEIARYLDKLEQSIEDIRDKKFNSGNTVIDAMNQHYLKELDASIHTKLDIRIQDENIIEDYDLCTIYANLIKNAVEELTSAQTQDRMLLVQVHQGQYFLKILVENSIVEPRDIPLHEEGYTTKADQRKHGYGIQNVKEAVHKLHGTYDITTENQKYRVEITIPCGM